MAIFHSFFVCLPGGTFHDDAQQMEISEVMRSPSPVLHQSRCQPLPEPTRAASFDQTPVGK